MVGKGLPAFRPHRVKSKSQGGIAIQPNCNARQMPMKSLGLNCVAQ